MIYVIDREDGSKQKVLIPDNARPMTEEDEKYFQAQADAETERIKRAQQLNALDEEISALYVQISALKRNLNKTDYQAIKFTEGEMPYEEYEPVKEQRRGWRKEINDLEALIATKEATLAELRRA